MSQVFVSKTMAYGAILISVGDEIVYYDENDHLPDSRILFDDDMNAYRRTIDENYSVLPKGIILQNIFLQNDKHRGDEDNDQYLTIDVEFESESEHAINWKLCYQKRIGIMVAIMAQNGSDDTITHILDSVHISMQEYFIKSKEMPLYILRIRCHVLSQRLLFFANHPTLSLCTCFTRNNQYLNVQSDNKSMLEIQYENEQKIDIELERIGVSIPIKNETQNIFKNEVDSQYQKVTDSESFTFTKPIQNAYDYLFKLTLIGDAQTGKSCLMQQFVDNKFTQEYIPTIGVDFKSTSIETNNKIIKIQIWDTSGQERFRSITHSYYRTAHGIMIVYDITNRDSFLNVRSWLEEIKKFASESVCKILVGTKYDLENERTVNGVEAQQLADEFDMLFYETSACISNVNTPFIELIKEMKKNTKSTSERGSYAVQMMPTSSAQKKLSFGGMSWPKKKKKWRLESRQKELDAAVSEQEDELDAIQMEIAATKESVQQGIALAIDRGDKLEDLDDKAINLSDEATVFNKKSK